MRQFLIYGSILNQPDDWNPVSVTPSDLQAFLEEGEGDVLIRINSPGGHASAGVAMHHLIKAYKKGKVTVVIDGICASAATLPAIAAETTRMNLGAVFLVHNAWTIAIGDKSEMEKTIQDLSVIDSGIADLYMERYNGTREELEELLSEDRYISRDDAILYGFVNDESLEPITGDTFQIIRKEVKNKVEEPKAQTIFEKIKEKK